LSSGQLFPSVRAVRRNAFALMPWKTISDSDGLKNKFNLIL